METKRIIATPRDPGWRGGPYDHMQGEWTGQKDGPCTSDPNEELFLGTPPGTVHLQKPKATTNQPPKKEE